MDGGVLYQAGEGERHPFGPTSSTTIKATAEEHKTLPIPPVVGAIALVSGIAVLLVPVRRRA